MILRLKSEVFHTKPTLWIHHQTKTQTKKKGSFSKRERGKERESERVTKRKRESDEIQVSRSVQEVYAGGVVTLETHSNVTYDYDYHIYASGIDRVPAEKYRILREKDASDDSR